MTLKILKSGKISNKIQDRAGKSIYEIDFKSDTPLTKAQIAKIIESTKTKIHRKGNFKVSTALKYDDLPLGKQWRNGYSFNSDEAVKLYDPMIGQSDKSQNEQNLLNTHTKFKRFTVRFWETPRRGGNTTNNDCLYFALKDSGVELPYHLQSCERLKKYFNLERNEKVPVDALHEISRMIKYQIQLIGEHTEIYGDYDRFIKIKLTNGHFKFARHKVVEINNLSFHEKDNLIVYDTERCYSNEKKYYDRPEDFQSEMRKTFKYSNDIYVYAYEYTKEKLLLEKDSSLRKFHKKFMLVRDELLNLTENKIDIFRSINFKDAGLLLFNDSVKCNYNIDEIDWTESTWLNCGGGFLYCPNEYEGYCYEYDLNGAYQWGLIQKFGVPISKPDYKHLDSLNDVDYFEYGLYKCTVEAGNKYFIYREDEIYTHFDLKRAKELKLKIIMKDGINVALYKKRISCDEMFGKTIEMFQKIEHAEKTIECKNIFKEIRNHFWGGLCQKNRHVEYSDKNGNISYDSREVFLENIKKHDNDKYSISYIPYTKPYKYDMARVGIFLVSYVRNHMSRLCEKYGDKVVRSATDSLFSTEILDVDIGLNYGQFKLKKEGMINIKNKMTFKWL